MELKTLIQQPEGTALENFDEIELSEDEIQAILRKAKSEKAAKIREAAYWDKVRKAPPPPPPKFTAEQLKQFIASEHPHYKIDKYNRDIFEALAYYFSGDRRFEEFSPDLSLNKGLMLYGAIGCGKTEMMRVFSKNTFRPFVVNPVRKITDAYADKKGGIQALNEYSSLLEVYPHTNLGISFCGRCFDDLGTEENRKNFGNEINVMQDVLYKIYDERLGGNFHLTTNLTTKEISEYYGERIRSRMREMFNVIEFPNDAPDRRV